MMCLLKNVELYMRIMGRLLYLTMTSPNIPYVVQTLSQYVYAPKCSYLDVAIWVV